MTLERYNQLALAAVLTMALGGVAVGFVGGAILAISDVSRPNEEGVAITQAKQNSAEHVATTVERAPAVLVRGAPFWGPSSEYLLTPVLQVQQSGSRKSSGLGSDLSYQDIDQPNMYVQQVGELYGCLHCDMRDVVFTEKTSESSRLLLGKQPQLITTFLFSHEPEKEARHPLPVFLLFSVVDSDSNGDGLLNADDASVTYLSNKSGENRVAITPTGTRLEQVEVDRDHEILILRVQYDSDGNKKFTATDQRRILKASLRTPKMASELVTEKVLPKTSNAAQ